MYFSQLNCVGKQNVTKTFLQVPNMCIKYLIAYMYIDIYPILHERLEQLCQQHNSTSVKQYYTLKSYNYVHY